MSRSHAIATTLLGCAAALLLTAFLLVLPARAQVAEEAETSAQSSDPSGPVVYDGARYFAATNAAAGCERFRFDGTGATLVGHFRPGAPSSNLKHTVAVGDHLAFAAWSQETWLRTLRLRLRHRNDAPVRDRLGSPAPKPASTIAHVALHLGTTTPARGAEPKSVWHHGCRSLGASGDQQKAEA